MASANLYALNRGEVSALALARVDQEALKLAAEQMVNWQPTKIGPMTMRPGLEFLGGILGDQKCQFIEAIYGTTDSALIELTPFVARFWVDDELVTRTKSGVTIQAFSAWTTSVSPSSTVTNTSTLTISHVCQRRISYAEGTITVPGPLDGSEFGLRIAVNLGDVLVSIGTASGDEDILAATRLDEGTHSLAIPANNSTLYLRIASDSLASRIVTSATIEAVGALTLPTPYAAGDMGLVRYTPSLDVLYLLRATTAPRKIERRSRHSFSIVRFKPLGGPFSIVEGEKSVTLSLPTGEPQGNVTLTASKPAFVATDVGRLIRIFHNKQQVRASLSAKETYTDKIRIAGVKSNTGGTGGTAVGGRLVTIVVQGTWAGVVTFQGTYDIDGLVDWMDVGTNAGNTSGTAQDDRDNVIAYFRLGFTGNNYTSGTADCFLSAEIGGGFGVAEIVQYVSATQVIVQTQKAFLHQLTPSVNWRMSDWQAPDLFPAAGTLHESRLVVGGNGRIWASSSDAFQAFDFDEIGDAATISRTIGRGPSQNINWILSLSRLMVGTDFGVLTIRSNALDAPLTPADFLIRYPSTDGTAPVRAVQIDEGAIFIQRSNRRIYGMFIPQGGLEHAPVDLTVLHPDIGLLGFTDIAIQRQLDTHIRTVRTDGQCVNLLFDRQEQARAFWRVRTDGEIENVAVLPGQREDQVYVCVKRTVNSVTKRYLEKFARLDECVGGTISKLVDSHLVYQGSPTAVLSVPHLIGEQVVVWADGAEVGFDRSSPGTIHTYTVDGSGNVTLPMAVINAVVGVPYTANFVSAKLAYAARDGMAINKKKRVSSVGLVLNKTHMQGIRYGHWHTDPPESALRDLPLIERGAPVTSGKIWESYDQAQIQFPGEWDTDARIQIEARAPRPATVLGVTLDMTTTS